MAPVRLSVLAVVERLCGQLFIHFGMCLFYLVRWTSPMVCMHHVAHYLGVRPFHGGYLYYVCRTIIILVRLYLYYVWQWVFISAGLAFIFVRSLHFLTKDMLSDYSTRRPYFAWTFCILSWIILRRWIFFFVTESWDIGHFAVQEWTEAQFVYVCLPHGYECTMHTLRDAVTEFLVVFAKTKFVFACFCCYCPVTDQ